MSKAESKSREHGVEIPPGMKLIAISSLKKLDRNPRLHPEEQVRALVAWILDVGFLVPILVGKNLDVLDGHARILAAEKIGMKRVPFVRADHLTDAQRRAFAIAANKIALMGTWDVKTTSDIIEAVKTAYPDLGTLGWSPEELKRLHDDVTRLGLNGGDGEPDDDDDDDEGGDDEPGGGDGGGDGGGGDDDDPELLPFSVLVTPDQREAIYATLKRAKERDDHNNTARALLTVIEEWKP